MDVALESQDVSFSDNFPNYRPAYLWTNYSEIIVYGVRSFLFLSFFNLHQRYFLKPQPSRGFSIDSKFIYQAISLGLSTSMYHSISIFQDVLLLANNAEAVCIKLLRPNNVFG